MSAYQYCPMCATALQLISQEEDGGPKQRMRCVVCQWTHWNNPTPVLAGIVQYRDQILLARNAAWPGRRFALITGFMEAGETPEEGITREIAEETVVPAELLETVIVALQRVDERTEAEDEAEIVGLLAEPQHMNMAEQELIRALQSDRDGGQEERY